MGIVGTLVTVIFQGYICCIMRAGYTGKHDVYVRVRCTGTEHAYFRLGCSLTGRVKTMNSVQCTG